MKKNGFTMAKDRSRRYPARTITDVDFVDDIALLARGGIGLHIKAEKTEFMWFNQRGNFSSLNGRSLKLVDKSTYLGNSISSTENDINTWLAKAWTVTDRLSVIWKSDLSDKIKRSCQYCCTDAPYGGWLSIWRKNLTAIAQECCKLYWTNPRGNIPQKIKVRL